MVEQDPWIAKFYARLRNPPPQLVVLSGPSGAGKDSLLQRMKQLGFPFHFVVTATTRPPRPGGGDGLVYHLGDRVPVQAMIATRDLQEHALVYGEYKGIPRRQVEEALRSGKDVILRIDVQGAATIRRLAPGAVLIFLTAASEEELIQRLQTRKTEDPEALARRIATAREELRRVEEFDYVVVNREGCLDEAVAQVQAILQAEKCRVHPRQVFL
ncbi:MAG: guanylate kinase [Anaerolineae bacterium]